MDKAQLQKNLYDLEYNKILNFQNFLFILIGTAVISIFLSESLTNKTEILIFLFLSFIYFKYSYDKKLNEIKLNIEKLQKDL